MERKQINTIETHKGKGKMLLSSIEDGKEFSNVVGKTANYAGKQAVAEAKVLKLPVTYLKGGEVIRENPDGKVEVLKRLKSRHKPVSIKKGTVLHARKDK